MPGLADTSDCIGAAIDEDSRSPVDVDTVLLDRAELQAITGAGENLTAIPGMQSKTPVDIDLMLESVPQQCQSESNRNRNPAVMALQIQN